MSRKYDYKIIDSHCDTIGELYQKAPLGKNEAQLDIRRMKEYKNYLQIFAVWTDASEGKILQKCKQDAIIEKFYDEIHKNADDIVHIRCADEIEKAWKNGKIAAILSVEGADCVKTCDDIDELYKKGVRCITLTWNVSNDIASGIGDDKADFGVSEFGIEAIEKMNSLGMLIDVSHISERAFWDVLEYTKSPIAASHSNSKAICSHQRNLTDKQFLALCKNGGVAGINYYPMFVNNTNKATIDDIIKHIEHFCSLGGENHIGLGGDFDGIDTVPVDLRGVENVYKLCDRLSALNYNESLINKITYENFLRLFKKVII